MSLTAVILTRNEEKNIATCIKSISSAGEIVVIDDYSTDRTVEIARSFGARVFRRKLENNFAEQRNFGDEKARGIWILQIDADEVVSKGLAKEIIEIKNESENANKAGKNIGHDAFYIPRRDFFLGRELKYGEAGRTRLLRLYKKGVGRWERSVHEVYKTKGNVGIIKGFLLHFSHINIRSFISSINYYTSLHAVELRLEGKRSNLKRIVVMPLGSFVMNYIMRFGFRDGVQGFAMALIMSLHSFLGWGKLWQLQKSQKDQ